jgi:hypothetical protein
VEAISLDLTDDEFERMSALPCELAAIEFCKVHLRRSDPGVTFMKEAGKAADLRFRRSDGIETDIEVKGTEAVGIAWAQLKVSSQQSHDRLKDGMPLWRVAAIGSRTVKLFVMRCGDDFEMVPEPRWSVHPLSTK